MLDIDAINNLLMELTADILKQDTSYIGENRSSNNASSTNKLPNGAGFTLNAPLKFDESVELDHRMYKPSGAIRPTQGEQSQEYEGF
jgi:hypothetical protein